MAEKDFMDPIENLPDKMGKLKKAGQDVAKSSKSPDKKIKARELIQKVIRGLPWEAKKMALDIIRAEINAGSKISAAGTLDPDKLPVDYTAPAEPATPPYKLNVDPEGRKLANKRNDKFET